jgi:methyltransferase (TIGR00027 family)
MKHDQSSRTAEYMAFFRALESLRPEGQRLFNDPCATHYLRPSLRRAVQLSKGRIGRLLVNRYADHRLPGARTSAIARTRLIDDALIQALAFGTTQLVILGSGFDCRAFRLPQLKDVTVFEVDHPATFCRKQAGLHAAGISIPDNVHFVQTDFNRQSLPAVLTKAGFDPRQITVFLWEGVTNYLTPEAVDTVLTFIAGCAPQTRIIFTYVHSGALNGAVRFEGARRLLADVARLNEPWTFGIAPENALDFLHQRGLHLDLDLSAREYRRSYFGPAASQMKGYDFYHVAVAHVPNRHISPASVLPIQSHA